MAVDIATFRVGFPEFQDAPDTLVQAALNDALAMTDATLWGARQDMGVSLRAAQYLALSPFGRNLSFGKNDGTTVYDARLDKLERVVAGGGLVL